MKKSKQLLLITALLFIWELPVIAQQPTDTTYIFRFVPNDDMFYVPWNGNDRSLHQLLNILEKNKKQLQAGQMYISVSSYAASANDILTSERMAYIRNNRIKSELITQGGLTEQMFVTDRAILLWERKTAQCRCRHLSGQRRKSSRNCGYRSGSTGRKL